MRKLLVLLFALVIGISVTSLVWSAEPPKEVKLEAKMGTVTFMHEKHAVERKFECQTCHHKGIEAEQVACRSCHKDKAEGDVLAARDAFHKTCRGCHEEKVKAGFKPPTKCKECHIKG